MGSSLRIHIFPGRFDSLVPISDFVTQAAEDAGLSQRAVQAVQLAVDEACSNIIQHAYGGEGRGDIKCTCQIDETGLTVILHDEGQPFDPNSIPAPDRSPDLEACTGGGLGLFFMRQLMDEVRFDFDQQTGNVLTMTKYREESPTNG